MTVRDRSNEFANIVETANPNKPSTPKKQKAPNQQVQTASKITKKLADTQERVQSFTKRKYLNLYLNNN